MRGRMACRLAGVIVGLASIPVVAAAQATDISDRPTQENDNAVFNYTRLELDAGRRAGSGEGSWTGEGWIGRDYDRVWWKTRGDVEEGALADVEGQVAYGRYIAPFWDLQAGYRRTVRPVGENFLVLGIRGLAPYRFDVSAEAFLSGHGRVSARGEANWELLWTNWLISRPGFSADVFAMNDPTLRQRAGIGDVEVRLPTRYEFSRQFAPYAELRYNHRSGAIADVIGRGASPSGWSVRGGVWLIF